MTQSGYAQGPSPRNRAIPRDVRQSIIRAALERLEGDDAQLSTLVDAAATVDQLKTATADLLRSVAQSVGVQILPTPAGKNGIDPEVFMKVMGIGTVRDKEFLKDLIRERLRGPTSINLVRGDCK